MEADKSWKCDVCGYIHTGDNPPDTCPVCGAGADLFSAFAAPIEKKAITVSTSMKCTVCGYVHSEGGELPDPCPVCGAPASCFEADAEQELVSSSGKALSIVIAGAGIAGVTAAESARRSAPDAKIILISKEEILPYHRLNLTRFLAGDVSEQDLELFPKDWYSTNNLEVIFSELTGVDREEKKVTLKSGQELSYDSLILTNGSHPFVPPLKGTDKKGVHVLRTVDDAKGITQVAGSGSEWICIGGGLLGLEAAGALRKAGASVTVVENHGWLLPRQLPEKAGRKLVDYCRQAGISVYNGRSQEILGEESVAGVLFENGETLKADNVLFSTGVRPNTCLARLSNLEVNKGVSVNSRMQTSDPSVYAAGDVAECRGKLYGIWPASFAQGMVAGMNAAGADVEFEDLARSNFLKVLDIDVFSVGIVEPADGSYFVYEVEEFDSYQRVLIRDGVIVGAVLYGDTSLATQLKDAIDNQKQKSELGVLLDKLPGLEIFL